MWYGDGISGNQDAEDVAGAAGVLMCLRGRGTVNRRQFAKSDGYFGDSRGEGDERS